MSILGGSASLKTMLILPPRSDTLFRHRVRDNAIHLALAAIAVFATRSQAAEVIPPKPPGYFQDNAGVVSKEAALRFNEQLAQFERETSNQVWVVVYPKMQSDSSIEDYTYRVKDF